MSAAKHTPGPWKLAFGAYIQAKPTPAHLAKFPRNDCVYIGHVSSFAEATTEEVVANGQLFAAAPKMAAALRACAHFIEDVAQDDPDRTTKFFAVREIWRDALAEAGVQS